MNHSLIFLDAEIKAMFPHIPATRMGWEAPRFALLEIRTYRGKTQWVAGYSHSRRYSHFLSGRVYDRVLGTGPTPDKAVAAMRQRLTEGSR